MNNSMNETPLSPDLGRAAATIPSHQKSNEWIGRLLGIKYQCKNDNYPDTKVLTLCSDQLSSALNQDYQVAPLIAGCVRELLGYLDATIVVVQSSTLEEGPWLGSIEGDHVMSDDISALADWASSPRNTLVVYIDSEDSSSVTKVMRTIGGEFFPNRFFFDRSEGSPRLPKLYTTVHAFGS